MLGGVHTDLLVTVTLLFLSQTVTQGGSSGISTSGTCTIHSHTDCSTFDGVLFRFMAPCTYVLAKTCSPAEALPMFRVEVVNEQNGNSSLPTVQQVTVNTGNFRVSLLKQKTHRVVVNGVWRKLPLSLGDGTVNIKSNPAAVVLGTSFGLSVSYDNAGAVHVALPPTYSDKVCGLCGNFNHLGEDDFRKPDGTNAHNATALAESWQTGQITSSCETILVPHLCDPLEEAEYASELYCGGLLSSTGPFADCQSVLEAESYFRGCVVSMCSAHGDPAVLCEALQVYTDICKEAGVAVPIWRNSTFCPPQCGENSYYNSCADGCPEVCSSLDLAGSCGSCEERCECESGFKLSGGKCVPAEDCGCWHNGKHYEKGATFLEGECVQKCQCMGNNDLWCTTMQCADNEVCKVKDGVKDCFPFKPATCRVYGDPHYMTFDKVAYDFQGGCSYTLATTCGEGGSVQFTVTGHNMHPPLQNLTRSKLEAVTLLVHLPYSTNGTYGSVWVHKESNYIILESTFGLRIMVDGQNRLFLQVDERYKHELCGMCGIYSGHQDDDLVTPDGQNATDAFQFGESWRVPNNNECTAYPNDPRRCDYDEEDEAYSQCNALLRDPFKSCHGPIHPGVYLRSCVYDYCATNGDQHTLCESLKSYAAACQVEGVELPPWQTADPPTTSTPPTTPTPTSPTPDQTFCPMNCDFEKNLCGWEQLIQDSFDWTRNSGPTPSDQTGPNQDHTTGAGFYIYIEGDRVTHGDSARLMSSVCHYDSPLCLQFWYHMHGSATAMALNIYLLKGNKATKLWSMMNNQGPQWHLGNVDISVSGPFQIIIEGIRGSNAQSDVAIDDVSIHFGTCSGGFPGVVSGTELPYITAEVLPPHPACNLDCSFNRDLCSWNQMITDAFDWTWQSGSTPTLMTGPSTDHTGDGHYLYIEGNSASHGDTARLISSECSDAGPQCLQFWYHMYGSADTMGLNVYLLQDRKADAVWRKRNDQGNMWHLAQVDLTTNGAFQIIFEGRRGSNDQSDVAIDDISLHHRHCAARPQPSTTALPESQTTNIPQPPPETQPPITNRPQPPTTARPQPPTTARPQPPTTDRPQPPTKTQPPTTMQPQPPTTALPESQTTNIPQPPPETQPPITNRPQLPTTARPQPPTTNSHYTSCIPACSPTCTQLNGPPRCSDSDSCVSGCVCDNGFVQKSRHCVPIQECGCVDRNGTKHQFNEVWYTNHCSQKCECEKDDGMGEIDCDDKDECDGNAVCLQNDEGKYYCQSTGFNECTIKGDPEYRTFDKMKHEFEGEHSYVLVQTKNLPNNLPDVYIEGINRRTVDDDDDSQHHDDSSSEENHSRRVNDEDDNDEDDNDEDDNDEDDDHKHDDDSKENEEHHRLQELKIRVYNHTVEFKKNLRLLVDGRRTSTPVSPTAGLNIREHSSHIYLKTDFGLSVEFDGHSKAEIILPRIYKRRVGGLCGNFDGQKRNDWMKPDGTMASRVQEFGESWRV
uniref:Zonadhesin-like n=1 Tax=Seriola dumerili TaxID=41447 RepID=A0A3B4V4Q9_SERDU